MYANGNHPPAMSRNAETRTTRESGSPHLCFTEYKSQGRWRRGFAKNGRGEVVKCHLDPDCIYLAKKGLNAAVLGAGA